jgi:hypothetical protein
MDPKKMTKKNKDEGIKTPAISKVAYFFGILCFIAGGIMIISGSLGAVVPGIIGFIFIWAGAEHSKKVTKKKLEEAYTEYYNSVPVSGATCPGCHKLVDAMNAYCPNCGTKLHVYDNTELDETRKNLEAAQKRIEELEREKRSDVEEHKS